MQIFDHIDKRVAIGFCVIAVMVIGWLFYRMGSTNTVEGPITEVGISPLDATLGRELLSALATLKSTKLDTSVFDDPVYTSLHDFGVEISAQPVGRRNPFALFATSTAGASKPSTSGSSVNGAIPKTPSGTSGKTVPKTTPTAPEPALGGFDLE